MNTHNKFLLGAMLLSLIATTAVIFVPFLANAFGFSTITIQEYFVSIGLAVLIIPIVEITKLIQRRSAKHTG